MIWIWFAITLFLIFVEATTVDLVAVWFALSSLIMCILVAIFPSLSIWWQVLIFLVVSAVLLLATRPLVKKFLARKETQKTNLELIVGATGVCVEKIENDFSHGAVKVNGVVWTARTADGSTIEDNVLVIIKEINGNKLVVEKKEN